MEKDKNKYCVISLTHVEALKKPKSKHLTDTENRLVVARGKE